MYTYIKINITNCYNIIDTIPTYYVTKQHDRSISVTTELLRLAPVRVVAAKRIQAFVCTAKFS